MRRPALATVCAWCGRLRSPVGEWRREEGIPAQGDTTHAICPECLERALSHATMGATMTRTG